METQTLLWVLGGMQAGTLFLVGWIKMDIKELWHRADTHGHLIECDGNKCKPTTKGVILEKG